MILLRACQLGISFDDLDQISIGMLNDIQTERANDEYDWPVLATQEDIDRML